jgi:NADPH:quinone reductase-like Zn-dependent oxidoreductase
VRRNTDDKEILMKAWRFRRYGSPDVLALEDVPEPKIASNEVLVRVLAASLNPYDWRCLHADPFLVRLSHGFLRPRPGSVLGTDLAGEVEAVGGAVTRFRPGDRVYGGVTLGAFAELASLPEDRLAAKPANLTSTQAAAVPMAAQTALQGLRDEGRIESGQRILVNGASGGVGTFAVQLAKAFGAEVTGVCSTRNVDLVRSIGADDVIDYTDEDFTDRRQQYDLLIDTAGNRRLAEFRRVLRPDGTFVIVGGGHRGRLLGPATQVLVGAVASPFVSQRISTVRMEPSAGDLRILAEWMESGAVTPVVDRTYPFAGLPEALRYLEKGHASGKVVVTVRDEAG